MDTCTGRSKVRRDALIALLLVLLPNLVLTGVGILMRGPAQPTQSTWPGLDGGRSGLSGDGPRGAQLHI